MEHAEIATLLARLVAAAGSNDGEIAEEICNELRVRLSVHLDAEEQLLFPDFAQSAPEEMKRLREDHRRLRALVDELAVGFHSAPLGAVSDLAQLLREHVDRENALFYRWVDRTFSVPTTTFTRGRSPAAPVRS